MKFSPSTKGFYQEKIHGQNIPDDVIEITDEEYEILKNAAAVLKEIDTGPDGDPILIDSASAMKTSKYSPLDFLELFSDQEQLAVVAATRESDQIKLWYDKMLASSFVDLNDPRTSAGLSALVTEGLIPQSRYDEIMGVAE